jgi:hypothetical protein
MSIELENNEDEFAFDVKDALVASVYRMKFSDRDEESTTVEGRLLSKYGSSWRYMGINEKGQHYFSPPDPNDWWKTLAFEFVTKTPWKNFRTWDSADDVLKPSQL